MTTFNPIDGAGETMVQIIELLLQHPELYWVAGAVALIIAITPIVAIIARR